MMRSSSRMQQLFAVGLVWSCCCHVAFALTPSKAKTMTANVYIQSGVEFRPRNSRSYEADVESAKAELAFYPRESSSQEVYNLDVQGQPQPSGIYEQNTENDKLLLVEWEYPNSQGCNFQVTGQVKTRNEFVPVRKRIRFPLVGSSINQLDMASYLFLNYQVANHNQRIQTLAEDLVDGIDDLYHAVFRIADWVHTQIDYSLESENMSSYGRSRGQNIQSSTQVLQNGYGKCDELTALFMSMCRSVGVPTRFVRGYSFNAKYPDPRSRDAWTGHAWAEVYFPGVGWVPFDVTKAEYGYLNCGNIMLGVSEDASDKTFEYSAQGRDIDLISRPLETVIETTGMTGMEMGDSNIEFYLDPEYRTVPFGSTVTLNAIVKNCNDCYMTTRLELAETEGARLLSGTGIFDVLLNPRETKNIPFEVQLDRNSQSGYSYDFPFSLYSKFGKEAETVVSVDENARRPESRQDYDRYDDSGYGGNRRQERRSFFNNNNNRGRNNGRSSSWNRRDNKKERRGLFNWGNTNYSAYRDRQGNRNDRSRRNNNSNNLSSWGRGNNDSSSRFSQTYYDNNSGRSRDSAVNGRKNYQYNSNNYNSRSYGNDSQNRRFFQPGEDANRLVESDERTMRRFADQGGQTGRSYNNNNYSTRRQNSYSQPLNSYNTNNQQGKRDWNEPDQPIGNFAQRNEGGLRRGFDNDDRSTYTRNVERNINQQQRRRQESRNYVERDPLSRPNFDEWMAPDVRGNSFQNRDLRRSRNDDSYSDRNYFSPVSLNEDGYGYTENTRYRPVTGDKSRLGGLAFQEWDGTTTSETF